MRTSAAQVSRILKKAGIPRAGRYTAWGYTEDGTICVQQETQVRVLSTLHGERGKAVQEAGKAALEAAGYTAIAGSRDTLTVTKDE